jgi:hypothetical protein
MISYFKYTSNNAFTLNGVDYAGFFNVEDGVAYTERKKGTTSEQLVPKNTFIADFYLNKMEFDNQFDSIAEVSNVTANAFSILNKVEMERLLSIINQNNLNMIVFKSLVVNNPQIINFTENNSHYYGLSSTIVDMRDDDVMLGKKNISQIDPFRNEIEWAFIEKIKYGALFVKSDQTFKYLCSTGFELYTLEGSFTDEGYIKYSIQELELPEEIYGIDYDESEDKITIIMLDNLKIYDAINYIECNTLILIDSIKLGEVDSEILTWGTQKAYKNLIGKWNRKFYNITKYSTEFIRFGNNYRTSIEGNILTLRNKYSTEKFIDYDLISLGIDQLLDVNIRVIDDCVLIFHKKSEKFHITFFDPLDMENSLFDREIFEFNDSDNYRISFSTYDSNVFYLNSTAQSHARMISNPTYPVGQMRENNLKYVKKETFGNYLQKFGDGILKWNSVAMDSNFYTNYMFDSITKSDKNYIFLLNSGRIYPIRQNIVDSYLSAIPLDLVKTYEGIRCSDTSFGLFLNKTISHILKDMLTLYTKATNSYSIDKNDVFLTKIREITYDTNNLYMNGNETVNVLLLQRILTLLSDLQKQLIANLTPQ